MNDAWARLQWMLQQWERKRFLVYHLRDYSVVSTGAISYTFGPQGQFNSNLLETFGLQSLALNAGGAGYAVNDTLVLLGGNPAPQPGNTPIQIQVNAVAAGVITQFTILPNAIGAYAAPLPPPEVLC